MTKTINDRAMKELMNESRTRTAGKKATMSGCATTAQPVWALCNLKLNHSRFTSHRRERAKCCCLAADARPTCAVEALSADGQRMTADTIVSIQ